MKIKQYRAKTFQEAIEMIKRELGDNALILSSEENKGNPSYVVVTAAVDYDYSRDLNANKYKPLKTSNNKEEIQFISYHKEVTEKVSIKPSSNLNDSINIRDSEKPQEKEKRELKPNKSEGDDLLKLLKKHSIKEEYAINLCKSATSLEEVHSLMKLQLVTKDFFKNSKLIMLIGPTGVGKTTTIAKLSAKALQDGKRVGIINLDAYRIGACEQIRIYARIMGIPLLIASNKEAFNESVIRFQKDRDIIFIDTMGRNPKDREYIKVLADISKSNSKIDIHLLISANSDDEYISKIYNYYQELPISYLAFTKIDEAIRYGSIYNLLMTSRKPLAYLTTGQQVPDDIEFPSPEMLSRIILQLC